MWFFSSSKLQYEITAGCCVLDRWKDIKRKTGKKPKRDSTRSSEQPRPKAKSLFDSLKVVSLPALPSPLLLVVRDASVLHLQLRRTAQVHKRHGDGGVMLWKQHRAAV